MRWLPYIHRYEEKGPQPRWWGVFAFRLARLPMEQDDRAGAYESLGHLLSRHVDLINALFCPDPPRSFALRYIAKPHPTSPASGHLELAFLGKIQGSSSEEAFAGALRLSREVGTLLGSILAEYPWDLVTDQATFQRIWQPLPWEKAFVAEIRRREDRVRLETLKSRPSLGRRPAALQPPWDPAETVYLVHSFSPRPSNMARLMNLLLLQPDQVVYQVALRPVWLTTEEEEALVDEMGKCEKYAQQRSTSSFEASTAHGLLASVLLQSMLHQLVRLQDAPFLFNLTVASPGKLSPTLLETVGVEVTAPVGELRESLRPSGGYDVVHPQGEGELQLARANAQFLEFAPWGKTLAPPALQRAYRLLDAQEAVGGFRLPLVQREPVWGIDAQGVRWLPLPKEVAHIGSSLAESQRIRLGESPYMGIGEPVFMAEKDRRVHVYIVGQTGTGKTTLLKTMILEDMQAGRGLAVIDPHGDLFHELLELVPRRRIQDVVVLDPTDTQYPIGLNVLEHSQPEEKYFIAREMRSVLERLLEDQYGGYAAEFAGPVFYQHVQRSLLLVMSNPKDPGTLLEFYEVYQREGFWRKWDSDQLTDPLLRRWLDFLRNFDPTKRDSNGLSWGEFLSSKFEDFVFDPKLRLIFGQKRSTFNLRQIMDEGKILLVNLAKGELAEANSRFLGMLLMARLLSVAMSRVYLAPEKRRPFYLYVDEFQNLATDSFTLLLSEARKFGVGLVLANQFLSQIRDPRITRAIFGNVGTLISFRVSQEDAQLLEPYFAPLAGASHLTDLPNWHACMRTTVEGQVTAPFTLRTIVPGISPDPSVARLVRITSQQRYGRPRAVVEEEIRQSLAYEP